MKDIQYVGSSDTMTITEEQFDAVDISSPTVVWRPGEVHNLKNEIGDLLEKDSRFAVVEENEDVPREVPENLPDLPEDDEDESEEE